MKKIIVFTALMLSCYLTAMAIDLKYGNTHKETILELEFTEGAKANEAFISWNLVGDWDKFSYHFSQGKVKKGVYTISASEYKDLVDQYGGIALFLEGKSGARSGNYMLSMRVKEVSKDMKFIADELDLDIPVNYTGKPLWLRFSVPAIILIALILLLILVLHVTAKFPKGKLQLGDNEVRLRGKKRISVKDELVKLGVTLPEDTDVVFVKKRFASFQGPCLKETKNCSLSRYGSSFSKGSVIRTDEEIKGLTSIDGKEIIIRYCI